MNKLFQTLICLAAFCICACATSVVIPEDLSPDELIQRAQEASDRNRYPIALQYYQTLLERNPTNIDLICNAEYEIAFIHYKQKKYEEAKMELNALLVRYSAPDGDRLPQKFGRLASIVLDRIAEKEKPREPFSLFKKNA
ncbi:MAG: hypothetical protein LBH97_02895 [Treponema sp.]|jgi:outer membrane protein assembly factor BamD (BamD/ComL family)|nr:hypothetical protein [Treponema sp.]